ncbi:hypothetical protein [Paenibacillus alkalitolerans]|uniref:hypothetical protein n=1 Tax=Paenibacillus alkalitolerans TaxID=2799335 RepID=UPI001F3F9BB4|nr:hypothetical protein [Paenibacillus alkalitolerans]
MSFSGDAVVLLLVVFALAIWGMYLFRRWLREKPDIPVPVSDPEHRPSGEAVELLAEHGYEVVHGKVKIPITVHKDEQKLTSALFVDYFARRDDKMYAVKLGRSRKPMDSAAGSSIREHLLVYALLYDNTAGVLYVDTDKRQVHKIRFELEL